METLPEQDPDQAMISAPAASAGEAPITAPDAEMTKEEAMKLFENITETISQFRQSHNDRAMVVFKTEMAILETGLKLLERSEVSLGCEKVEDFLVKVTASTMTQSSLRYYVLDKDSLDIPARDGNTFRIQYEKGQNLTMLETWIKLQGAIDSTKRLLDQFITGADAIVSINDSIIHLE